jgi:hypothetical protein
MQTDESIEFYGELKVETEDAYLVFDGRYEVWLPKEEVLICRCVRGTDWEFVIPQGLALEEGII